MPAEKYGVQVVSIGFMTDDDSPVIWRGPMLHGAIQQFFKEVAWNDLDYLIVDMPPGTGDVALSLSQTVPVVGAIVVTTPQQVSLADSRRAIRMYQKLTIPTIGIVENMSYYACSNCHHEADIFGHGGGEALAQDMNVPFLGRLPIYQPIREGSDRGVPLVESEPASPAARAFLHAGRADGRAGVDVGAPGGRGQPRQDPAHPGAMTPDRAPVIDLPYTKRTLDNGLDVIVHEDHHVPIVAVNLWYHVGSKNEQPGRTGFAHLFEHLMFEGSASTTNSGYFAPLQAAGGQLNGSTNTDRTNYWEVVPTNAVDLALWMESDRMAYLLPALTRERFETQRDVVLNERRQNYENRPYGLALMAVVAALFPPDHPYHWMTIGSADDIRAMEFEDVREFFRTYYHPANASLVLAGDIADRPRRSSWPSAISATSPPASAPAPVRAAASLDGERRLVLEDRVELPRLYIGWHTPAMFEPGDAELDLVADLLANGKTARLYQTLVYDRRVALDVSAAQQSREMGGLLRAGGDRGAGRVARRPGRAVDEEIAPARGRRTDRAPKWSAPRRRPRPSSSTTCRRSAASAASPISSTPTTCMRGDPGFFARDLDRYRLATRESVRDAARRYLQPGPPRGAERRAARPRRATRCPAPSRSSVS